MTGIILNCLFEALQPSSWRVLVMFLGEYVC